ncbi:hypothetical protein Ate02nite_59590 [Paractinoplanes tereljensis]|uniref:Uncharacterized protein n=2 Tax=Paractinoplanes tereljensis TaxID=571912 RepID=A0A919NQI0_9ACTN|nr:hypothetical protein Ate02nite_59590 [Actinoplanes tereljensis]
MLIPVHTRVSPADLEVASRLGESFGGLNTLFSGLAFVVIIGTLIYQRADILSSREHLQSALRYQAELANAARRELEENRLQMRASLFATAEQSFVPLERTIADTPSVLRFYRITDDDLRAAKITAEEFAYLIATFTAAGIHIKAAAIWDPSTVTDDPFVPSSYHYELLSSDDVRRAWPLISRAISNSAYKRKIEATIARITEDSARR